ncbi:MAG: hypothetical protein COV57_01195 [Candidatus Liptonbacteria bacterium CG11_big_fil_rev_8_21_14_0_20_35_14]|uniref:Tyr recombinase domain-containing protein n=1 Tax=Candidatus Liptonbacteria bacterium CG11_big_fil_rev_8_21_14_0_20_35_14 TaxID=1974634 RepID=A0A2H0NAB4_9BACT|nr:MAG: hypothetical protein COV57_01195 [Candidatus Liptonbacteria bacterium CG11_big_fil_rev_8_21_14_0_20_35_14]
MAPLHKQAQGLSSQAVSLYANAINFIFCEIYKQPNFKKIRHPKRSQKLPVILSRLEIGRLINAVDNIKHKLILYIAYGAGLRVSEVVRLRVRDVDTIEMTIWYDKVRAKKTV